jgi:hypothetical protein
VQVAGARSIAKGRGADAGGSPGAGVDNEAGAGGAPASDDAVKGGCGGLWRVVAGLTSIRLLAPGQPAKLEDEGGRGGADDGKRNGTSRAIEGRLEHLCKVAQEAVLADLKHGASEPLPLLPWAVTCKNRLSDAVDCLYLSLWCPITSNHFHTTCPASCCTMPLHPMCYPLSLRPAAVHASQVPCLFPPLSAIALCECAKPRYHPVVDRQHLVDVLTLQPPFSNPDLASHCSEWQLK